MEDVARQFIRALRGPRSQLALSRKLGYRGNPVADWEAGRRYPTAEEALRMCTRVGIDVEAAFARFHPAAAPALAAGLWAWLEALRGRTGLMELAARVGRSRFAVARWLSGEARPRLPDWLRLVTALTDRLSDLLAELVPIEVIPTLAEEHARRQQARLLAFEEPWTEAVLRVVETGAFAPAVVAARLRIPEADAARCLEKLTSAGIVQDGRVIGTLTVDTRAIRGLRRHWTRVVLDRMDAPEHRGLFSYNVVSVSVADLARIEELHRAYFRQVRAIVAASEPPEVVALVNVHLLELTPALSAALADESPRPMPRRGPGRPRRADEERARAEAGPRLDGADGTRSPGVRRSAPRPGPATTAVSAADPATPGSCPADSTGVASGSKSTEDS
jgi:transcriptional regulator with XRE-family HTH domain